MNKFKSIILLIFLISNAYSEDVLRPEGEISSAYDDYYNWSPPVNFGIESGVTYNVFSFSQSSNLNYQSPDNYSKGQGYAPYVSGVIDYRLNGFLGIQCLIGFQQVNYSNKSNSFDYYYDKQDSTKYIFESDWQKKINYLNTQISIRYDISRKFIFNLGAFLNYKVGESEFANKITPNIDMENMYFLKDIKKAYNEDLSEGLIYGVTSGLAYRYYFTNELFLNFQGRYQFSFVKALKDVKIYPQSEEVNKYYEISGRQSHLFSFGISLLYKY